MEMEQPQQRNKSMVFVLVGSAVFLAVATFIGMLMLTARSSPSDDVLVGQEPIASGIPEDVNGVVVFINPDQSKTYYLVGENTQPVVAENDQQGGLPTDTPIPPTVEPTATVGPTPKPTPDPVEVKFKQYTVVAGDTLYSIAEVNNSSIELMAQNDIAEDHLVPGAVLNLPYANPAHCPGDIAYVVRDKDTVYRIAAQFQKTVAEIAQLNGLDAAYSIRVTEVICIPA